MGLGGTVATGVQKKCRSQGEKGGKGEISLEADQHFGMDC